MDFKAELMKRTEIIENILKDAAPKEEGYQKTIFEAMNYSLMAGGKRLRPMLIQETYKLFGGDHEAIIRPFMAAIEMIHTYSLIHDDLPALDNDEYRRGRKTSHVVFGEAMAILAGDALLNYAFETASGAFDLAETEDEFRRVAKALQILSSKPGIYGMIGGQVVDVEREGQPLTKDVLDFIHEMKTSALIECSMMMGAVLAGAAEDDLNKVEQMAKNIGISFQIQDDILDVTSSLEVLGKQTHSDEKNHKTTYVTLFGIEGAMAEAERFSKTALDILDEISQTKGLTNPFLTELICQLVHREK
ncbi:polyprenyl synthetase family protein [Frisingicoccus sp.]|uniref:polyprenyl synthetase family protein n=1 Tax=Frisingicoccus sp. TaxID=1918627 RepID=UPI003866779B